MSYLQPNLLAAVALCFLIVGCAPIPVHVTNLNRDPEETRETIARIERRYCLPYQPPQSTPLPEMVYIPPDYTLDYRIIAHVAADYAERLAVHNKQREDAHRQAYEAHLETCTDLP